MKLWIDDVRPAPEGWEHAKTYDEAHKILNKNAFNGAIEEISFDHDLGDQYNRSGYDLAKMIEEWANGGHNKRLKWSIHSANPVGRQNIEMAMKNADRYWTEWEKHQRPEAYRKSNGEVWQRGFKLTLHKGFWWMDVGCAIAPEGQEVNLPIYDGPDNCIERKETCSQYKSIFSNTD